MKKRKILCFLCIIVVLTIIVLIANYVRIKVNIQNIIANDTKTISIEIGESLYNYDEDTEVMTILSTMDVMKWTKRWENTADVTPSFYMIVNKTYLISFFDNISDESGVCKIAFWNSRIEIQTFTIDSDTYTRICHELLS